MMYDLTVKRAFFWPCEKGSDNSMRHVWESTCSRRRTAQGVFVGGLVGRPLGPIGGRRWNPSRSGVYRRNN